MCSGIYLLLPLHVQDLPVISESFPSSGRNGYPFCTEVTQQKGGPSVSCYPALPTSPAFTLANSQEPLKTEIWPAFSCLIVLTSWNTTFVQYDCLCLSHSSGLLVNVLREALVESPVKIFTMPISSIARISIFMRHSSFCSIFVSCFLNYTLNIKDHKLLTHQYTPGAHSRLSVNTFSTVSISGHGTHCFEGKHSL